MFGLEGAWSVPGEVDGLMIFEGPLRAYLEAIGGVDCCWEDSDTLKGVCNLATGN